MKDVSSMTAVSRYMYRAATSRKLSLKGAIAQLRDDAHLRSTKDILLKFSGLAPEEEGKLQSVVCQALAETTPDMNRDSISRKVRIWINSNGDVGKASAIQLAFAFHLSLEAADELLKLTTSEGFHWRDPEDIVFGYALIHGLSYAEAIALHAKVKGLGLMRPSPTDAMGSVLLTHQIRRQAMDLANEEELIRFLTEEQSNLGQLHNTAYSIFIKYMDILQSPAVDPLLAYGMDSESSHDKGAGSDAWNTLCEPDDYSVRDILTVYLHDAHIPRETRASKGASPKDALILSAMQRNIRSYWPDEVTLSKMKSRSMDVTRKVLILLFVAVDGYEVTEYDEFEEELSEERQFEDMYERLNQMLNSCGFAPLDTRVPFDWMILFCMCSGSKDFLDARMERFLKEVFSDVQA